jgi:peroxiredoxin Q/BCP
MRWLLSCLFVAFCLAVGCAKTQEGGLVNEGSVAPAIETIAHNGERVSLAALKGKPVVIYFYPKDDTPGCTKEACEIRDAWSRFKAAGAIVLGVSTDDSKSHTAFADKHRLPFLLVPDSDRSIANAYGVPVRLGMAKRVTFVIDAHGNVAKVFPDVNPKGHAEQILAVIEKLKT